MSDKMPKTPEWNYPVEVNAVESWPFVIEISPEDSERTGLINRLGVLALDFCEAKVTLNQNKGSQVVHVSGVVRAQIRHNCVVTMEPIESDVHEEFEAWYADSEQAVSIAKARREKQIEKGRGEMPILSESEAPEAIIDGKINIGELVTQYLSLGIDPYPHSKDADYPVVDGVVSDEAADEVRANPFAALKDWKFDQDKGGA